MWGRRNKDVPTEALGHPTLSETSQIIEKFLPEESHGTDQGFEQDISEMINEVMDLVVRK